MAFVAATPPTVHPHRVNVLNTESNRNSRVKPHTSRKTTRPVSSHWRATAISREQLNLYERYLRDIAKAGSPPYLDALIFTFTIEDGVSTVAPSARSNLHPFFIPLAKNNESGVTKGLLRWPTPPEGMELPVVESVPGDPCLTLLAPSAKTYVTRAIASADFSAKSDRRDAIRAASSLALTYQDGDVDKSGLGVERFLTISAGGFPDIYEGLARFHLAKEDVSSALITCERAAHAAPGWGRPHAFHADVLSELGRVPEARDAARFSLTLPLWTMGSVDRVREMGRLAGYEDDSSLGKIYRRLFEDERMDEIQGGKAPEQVALDRAAWLLDVFVADRTTCSGGWDDVRDKLAELYDVARMEEFATFVRY